MLQQLSLQDFRNVELKVWDIKPGINYVLGHNGAGKSTIKEGICFALTGTDSCNSKSMDHLLRIGAEHSQVTIQTDLGNATRTLFKGRRGSIKAEDRIIPQNGPETILAAFIPGFFMTLGTGFQLKILDELLPKINRKELLLTLCAEAPMTEADFSKYNFDKRLDITVSNVTKDRREAARLVDFFKGQLKILGESKEPTNEWPQDIYTDRIARLEVLDKIWRDYNSAHIYWARDKDRVANAEKLNTLVFQKKIDLQNEMDKLKLRQHPEYQQVSEKIKELQTKKLLEPEMPELQKSVDVEFCPTCGQAVSPRHKENVKVANERLIDSFRIKLDKVRKHNLDIQAQIKVLSDVHEKQKKQYLEVERENDRTSKVKMSLLEEFNKLQVQDVPRIGLEPERPSTSYDEQEYIDLKKEQAIYLQKKAVYESELSRYKKAKEDYDSICQKLEAQKKELEKLQVLEEAMKRLPHEELRVRAEQLNLGGGITFLVQEEVSIFMNNIPYGMLSTGQKMKVDIKICNKINSLMKEPLNMIFIDNADLVDNIEELPGQVFVAKVTSGELEVK